MSLFLFISGSLYTITKCTGIDIGINLHGFTSLPVISIPMHGTGDVSVTNSPRWEVFGMPEPSDDELPTSPPTGTVTPGFMGNLPSPDMAHSPNHCHIYLSPGTA